MEWINEIKKSDISNRILSFEDYMELFEKDPRKECRPSCVYFKDMFEHFGTDQQHTFNLFKTSSPSFAAVQGQHEPQEEIFQSISNFVEEGFNNKFILLVGPNGSSKSSLIKKIMDAGEDYSLTDEGSLYTFSWIFPVDSFIKGGLGFGAEKKQQALDTYAYIEDREVSAILGSDLKDHPILLIPLNKRRNILDKLFKDTPDYLNSIKKSYLYNSELSKRNKLIFDSLLKTHKGDYLEVYKYIRVERLFIDKRLSNSAVTIEPQMHVDANIQQITMDRRLASLPASLQSLNLFSLGGEVIMANRGILEFSDILKRPIDTYKYLLTTLENHAINLGGIISELDVLFIGSSNELHFNAFKQHPDYNSFRGRFNFIKVPYLLNYQLEENIYEGQVESLKDRCHFEKHAIKALSLWAVMSRLRKPNPKNYPDKKLGSLISLFSPLQKALYLSTGSVSEQFTHKEKQVLQANYDFVWDEYKNDPSYEGMFGISPRDMKQIIYDLANEYRLVTFIEVLEYLRDFSERKNEFDFLNIAPENDYHNTHKLIDLIESFILNQFDEEVRSSLGLIDERSYEDYISKYVHQIRAYIKGEKIKNTVTGKHEECDMFFIEEFENNVQIKDNRDDYRSHIISRLGAFSIDNPGAPLVMTEVFPDIIKFLKESFREEQKKVIREIGKSLVFYISDNHDAISNNSKQRIELLLENLRQEYQYSTEGAFQMLQYLIKRSY